MKLYYSKGACSLAVRILINELGLKCDYESVDLKAKQTQTGKDFLKINPKGSVPVLQKDDGELLTENLTIQIYLVEQHPNSRLLPLLTDPRRYRILEMSNFITTDLHKGCGPLFSPDVPEELKEAVFRPIIKKKLHLIENRLQDNPYLMGDEFSLPDGYLFVILSWMPHLGVDFSENKKLTAYFERLKKYPSIVNSLEQEANK
jgi:glutathione S-transferase